MNRTFLSTALHVAIMAAVPLQAAIVVGQIDNFESGGTLGWSAGAAHPDPPEVILTGGPGGTGDAYLEIDALGGGGPGSKLSAINTTQWAGDYIAGGVNAIRMDVNNFGPSELSLRLLFAEIDGMNVNQVSFSTDAIVVPAGSGWVPITFSIVPSALTASVGTPEGALMNATELRIFHNVAAAFPGPPTGIEAVTATLGVDNIRAVPEPSAVILAGLGLVGLAIFKRRTAGIRASRN